MRLYKNLIALLIIFFSTYVIGHSQCTCMGGAAVGGLTPVGGSANIGVMREGNIRVSVYYRNGFGDTYFLADGKTDSGRVVKEYEYDYAGFNAGYGISEDFTIELETGYFLRKVQDFFTYKQKSSGFSHISASVKYNLYSSMVSEWEYTAGIGGRAPLNFTDDNVPQNVLPSTGAYGLIIHSFLHKGFMSEGLHCFLINRAEINTENSRDYLYGYSIFSSLLVSKSIVSGLSAALEVRNEFRARDKYRGGRINDSGGLMFVVAPQLSFKIDDFYISAMFDYPFYKYYNGKQLSNSYSLGFMVTWQDNLLGLFEEE